MDKQAEKGDKPMTIQRRPRPQWRRRAAALAAGGLVLYLVAATAASPTAASAWEAVRGRGDVALSLLQSQLAGGWNTSGLPAEAALVIGQSPVLRSNRDAVMALRTCAPWVREIGDCNRVSNITNAVYQGYHAALDI